MKLTGPDDVLRCSFCHKSQDVVGKLICAPSDYPRAYICDECIAVCNSILVDDRLTTDSAIQDEIAQLREKRKKLQELTAEVWREMDGLIHRLESLRARTAGN
jgi:ATP-dependent Clp protease ATP-binding subunit ClpX